MNNDICFFYHRNNGYDVTIAYQRLGSDAFRYGAAFCHPEDQFDKKMGRNIATGRMEFCSPIHTRGSNVARWQLHDRILESLDAHEFGWVPENFWSGVR